MVHRSQVGSGPPTVEAAGATLGAGRAGQRGVARARELARGLAVRDSGARPDVDALVERVLTLPRPEWSRYLRDACKGDRALLNAVEAILAEADDDGQFLRPGGALTGPVFDDLQEQLREEEAQGRLRVGDRIGPYEVGAEIGRGGMGEVYRARDPRLGRDVALKVLPERFDVDPERTARFEREARVLATLNHPNIAAIYGVERADHLVTLVLELVEGPTLAERLTAGPLSVSDALAMASQLVEALDAAHERNIVHRDLKPANIKLSDLGRVKVLDFGLSKAVAGPADLTDSLTRRHRPGALLGTASYVSPEQVKGEAVDARADIWAFGCVLYEALTGRRAFVGDTASDVLTKVLHHAPDFARLPPDTPRVVRRLLRACLRPLPSQRLAHIRDARRPLRPPSPRGSRRRILGRLATAALAGAALLVAAVALRRPLPATDPQPVARVALLLPATDSLIVDDRPGLAISPDGTQIAYRAERDGVSRLFLRALDQLQPVPILGTESATAPFFSTDGRWLGFATPSGLMRLPVTGGPPITISGAPDLRSASWGPDDTIVLVSRLGPPWLWTVPASGGTAQSVDRQPPVDQTIIDDAPQLLPDGRAVLFAFADGPPTPDASVQVGALHRRDGSVGVLTGGRQPHYVRPEYLVVSRRDGLWAAALDADAVELHTPPIRVVDDVRFGPGGVRAHFAVARSGSLVYVPAGDPVGPHHLVLVQNWSRELVQRVPVP